MSLGGGQSLAGILKGHGCWVEVKLKNNVLVADKRLRLFKPLCSNKLTLAISIHVFALSCTGSGAGTIDLDCPI